MDLFPKQDRLDPRVEAAARLQLGVAGTILALAATLVGLALLVPADRAPLTRALGALLIVGGVLGAATVLRWARAWKWSYDRPEKGLSAGETFLLGYLAVTGAGALYPLIGFWCLACFLVIPVAAVARQRR